jgi:hypothetical protein
MAAPGREFPWTRVINNAVPNFARDDPNDVNLSTVQADNLLRYQYLLPHPRYLSEISFLVAGIVGAESLSKKVYKALVKHSIILPVPEMNSKADVDAAITVNTAGIDRRFASQQASISIHAQRKLVGMLFFWEEECTRWKLLDAEEQEIMSILERGEYPQNRDLAVALEAVEMKRKMLPSQRGEGTANVSGGMGHQLPPYA